MATTLYQQLIAELRQKEQAIRADSSRAQSAHDKSKRAIPTIARALQSIDSNVVKGAAYARLREPGKRAIALGRVGGDDHKLAQDAIARRNALQAIAARVTQLEEWDVSPIYHPVSN